MRIAGVEVGKVKKVEAAGPDSTAATITMEIKDNGLPIHTDAYLKIRPRIFLEGNFFVDLQPGSPSAPILKSGHTIGIGQTDGPVQLDQVLTALQSDPRANLQVAAPGLRRRASTTTRRRARTTSSRPTRRRTARRRRSR